MVHLKYRPDIDGLRAVAVLGVIFYHAFPHLLPGGFIGVDIFFVISGYLISGILYKGHRAGNFSFKEFYARRIRRLFPALITVLLLTMAYGWVILLHDEFVQLGKHVAAGTLFVQNIVFWQESGYFDTLAMLKPLLHLWSLAVEEQFYIFFPPLLLLAWKCKWPLAPIMGVLLIASLVGNFIMAYQNQSSDFFLTPYRAWEFLGGSLLAWWHFDKGHEEDVPFFRNLLSVGGAGLLVCAMTQIQRADHYPGWRALLPVTGSLLVIEGGQGAWVNRAILSQRAIVWIGLISYPLYLFHWPALSFLHIVEGERPSDVSLVGALFFSLGLSFATYFLVERPMRFSKSQWVLPFLMISFIITGVVGLCVWKGVIQRPLSPEMEKVIQSLDAKNKIWWDGLETVWRHGNPILNKAGADAPRTLYIGDSNMQQYAPRILALIKAQGVHSSRGALFMTCGGVPPIPGISCSTISECDEYLTKLAEITHTDKSVDRVVIAALWNGYFANDSKYSYRGIPLSSMQGRMAALNELGSLIRGFVSSGKKVTVLLPVPNGPELDPRSFYKRSFVGGYIHSSKDLPLEQFRNRVQELTGEITKVALSNGAMVIDPSQYLSVNGNCIREEANDGPIRYDGCHFRPDYVRNHINYLDATMAP